MKAVLSNPNHPEYGVATIPFPIPTADYDNCIALLTALEIGGALRDDCKVEEIAGEYPFFQKLEGTVVNVEELDYLVKHMKGRDQQELAKFGALSITQDIHSVSDFINLVYSSDNVPLVQDFTDLEKIGRDYIAARHNNLLHEQDEKHIDFERAALDLLQQEQGKVTPYGVVYDKDFALKQFYKGWHFADLPQADCVMETQVFYLESPTPETFYLPMPDLQLERHMQRYQLDSVKETWLRCITTKLPEEAVDIFGDAKCSLSELNRLCQATAEFSAEDYAKLGAATGLAQPTTVVELTNLAQKLELFDFVPDIRTPMQYGKHMICESGHFEYDDNLGDYYNFEKYGNERVAQEYGQFSYRGYISYHGVVSFPELLAGVNCERMEMGGMA